MGCGVLGVGEEEGAEVLFRGGVALGAEVELGEVEAGVGVGGSRVRAA